jgi:hypothetical protein
MVQWAVKAWNHLERKDPELVILTASHGNQLLLGNLISTQHVLGALRSDDRGMSLERDLRNIKDVVVMRMRDEDKVCSLNMRLDSR